MALLTPPDILPEAMRFLVRALLALKEPEADKDELLALVAPRGLVEAMAAVGADAEDMPGDESDLRTGGNVIAAASLDALRNVGVVEQRGNAIALIRESTERWKSPAQVDAEGFSRFLLDRVLQLADPTASPGESQGVTDLVHALILLHTSDEPLRPFDRFEPSTSDGRRVGRSFMETLQEKLGADRQAWPFPNKEQWLTFRRWASYLRLARPVGAAGLIPDASAALIPLLAALPDGAYDVRDFVARCASVLPILDGGALHFGHDSQLEGDHAVLSPGLSVSLLQLEADGVLVMEERSDMGGRTLRLRPDKTADKRITTVIWKRTPVRRSGR
jgi:hypothetical protein